MNKCVETSRFFYIEIVASYTGPFGRTFHKIYDTLLSISLPRRHKTEWKSENMTIQPVYFRGVGGGCILALIYVGACKFAPGARVGQGPIWKLCRLGKWIWILAAWIREYQNTGTNLISYSLHTWKDIKLKKFYLKRQKLSIFLAFWGEIFFRHWADTGCYI